MLIFYKREVRYTILSGITHYSTMLNIHPFTLDVGDKKIEADNKPVPVCDLLFRLLLSESEIHQLFVNHLLHDKRYEYC